MALKVELVAKLPKRQYTIGEGWVSLPIRGVTVKKISLPFFYQLGAKLNPLTEFTSEVNNRRQIWLASFPVHSYVYTLLETFKTLTVCRAAGIALIDDILKMQNWVREAPSDKREEEAPSVDFLFQNVITAAKNFEIVLTAELQTLATYHCEQHGIYETTDLIEQAERVLPKHALKKIKQDVIEEIRQSGRCLAFDIATASAFHIIRATELVIHKYYLHVCKPKSQKKLDSWGAYIAKLEQSQAPEVKEVVAMLQQIKDRHRNLIMHPEMVLSPDEAFTLFEIVQGSIIAMADKLPTSKKKKA